MYCTEASLIQQHEFHTIIKPLYCNCWTCEICKPRRRARLMREAADGAPNRLITLTVRAQDDNSQDRRARAHSNIGRPFQLGVAGGSWHELNCPTEDYLIGDVSFAVHTWIMGAGHFRFGAAALFFDH